VLALFKLGHYWFDGESGFLTLFLTLMSPLVFGLLRDNLVDFCFLTTIVCVQYLIVKSRGGWNPKAGFLLGLAIGFSLLTKWTLPVSFAFTAIFIFFQTWFKKRHPFLRSLLRAGVVILMALIISLPWYLRNLADFRAEARHALLGDNYMPL